MRILMTADTVGGVWTYSLELAKSLAPYDVEILLATLGAPLSESQWACVNQIDNVIVFESDYRLEWMDDPWDDVEQSQEWVRGIARRARPDLIHTNTYCHAAMSWNIPVLLVGHSCALSWHQEVRGQQAGLEWEPYRRLVSHALRNADLVIAPTGSMLAMLERHYGPLRRKQAILNGLPPRGAPSQPKEDFVFTAGRFWDEAKNLATAARAAPHMHWPLRVAGLRHPDGADGKMEEVEFLGALSAKEMHEVYSRASIYVLPAKYEPFGLTALEAAFDRCALVLGDIATLREVWGDAALFVPPDDHLALADAVNRLIADPALRRRQADAAYLRALQLNSDRQAASYMKAYGQLLASPQRRLQKVS
jgi:glycosyltransferase involved in cell wall biosynthesis